MADPFKDAYVNQLREKLRHVSIQCLFISKSIDKYGKIAYDHTSEAYQKKAAERDEISEQLRAAYYKVWSKPSD